MSKKRGNAQKDSKAYSGIAAHKIEKKVLVPPLMAVPGMTLMSWMNDRMPELLWAALLLNQFGRERALARFRSVAELILTLTEENRSVQPTHSGLASLNRDILRRFLSAICSDDDTRKALRPLLLFGDLPARNEWGMVLGQTPSAEDWEPIKAAVLHVLDHQSQDATDCRWLKVLFQLLSGTLHLQNEEQVREILEYPNYGLPQAVRPLVRCMEGTLDGLRGVATAWPESFWNQCRRDTPCDARHTMEAKWPPHLATTRRRIQEVREALARHEGSSIRTTAVDARHDAAFGFGAYGLAILEELLRMGNSTAILGRLGLRTLLECYVTLSYLKTSNDLNLWTAYRQYSSAQAKLAFLKLDDPGESIPSSIDVEILRQLANEDRWLEYVSIDLGHWAAKDLRKMSDGACVKPDYDRLYPWTSAFTHNNWAAVRNSCFDLCINPLHRLHRRLRSDTADLGDVVQDACEIVDKLLSLIDSLYPGFTARVTLPQSKAPLGAASATDTEQAIPSVTQLATIQREFFQILDEFFRLATGVSAEEFAPLDSFGEKIKTESQKLINRGLQAHMYVHEALQAFYTRFAFQVFPAAKKLAGLKFVLGGTSRFGESQLDCIRKMLLYADSILVPDPVLPWIESARAEERFRNILLLETAFVLLHLKPLADAELSSPPVIIFPSFEKTLEERDATTQTEIEALTIRFLSHFLGHRFDGIEELREFAVVKEEEFMAAIDQRHLFVAPGGQVGQPLQEALEQYEQEIRRWRTDTYQSVARQTPKGVLVLSGLMERIAPQYHLLENAGELSACPLIPLLAPWHYYSLMSRFFADQLRASGSLGEEALGSLELVSRPEHKWLGNVPVPELVHLLDNRENLEFRTTLSGIVSKLHNAPLDDLRRIAAEVPQEIASLLQHHDGEVSSILEKYRSRYGVIGEQRYVTAGVNFMMTLAPTARCSRDTVADRPNSGPHPRPPVKEDDATKSLLGVLAVAEGT